VAPSEAPGIYGGEQGLAAYLAFMGVDSIAELEQQEQEEQLQLFEDVDERRAA